MTTTFTMPINFDMGQIVATPGVPKDPAPENLCRYWIAMLRTGWHTNGPEIPRLRYNQNS